MTELETQGENPGKDEVLGKPNEGGDDAGTPPEVAAETVGVPVDAEATAEVEVSPFDRWKDRFVAERNQIVLKLRGLDDSIVSDEIALIEQELEKLDDSIEVAMAEHHDRSFENFNNLLDKLRKRLQKKKESVKDVAEKAEVEEVGEKWDASYDTHPAEFVSLFKLVADHKNVLSDPALDPREVGMADGSTTNLIQTIDQALEELEQLEKFIKMILELMHWLHLEEMRQYTTYILSLL